MDYAAILKTVGSLVLFSGALAALVSLADRVLNSYGICELDINSGQKVLSVQGGSSLLVSLASQGIFIPSACGGKATCGLCKVGILEGAGPILPTEEPFLSPEDREKHLRLSCQTKVKGSMKLVIPEELFNIREYQAQVVSITDMTYDTQRLRLKLPEGEPLHFKAGQYMQIYSKPYGKVKEEVFRAYSISSKPSEAGWLEFIIRLVPGGLLTTYVHTALKEGDRLRLSGSYGDFYLRGNCRELILIAGGSGLAPIRSLIYDVIEKGRSDLKMRFFFGANTVRDLYYVEEFQALEKEYPFFSYIPAVARPAPEDGWTGETGFVTAALERQVDSGQDREAYLCGSPGMLDACINLLKDRGFTDERIFFDKF